MVRVSIVATGIDSNLGISAKPLASFVPINLNNDIYKSEENVNEEKHETHALVNENINQELENNEEENQAEEMTNIADLSIGEDTKQEISSLNLDSLSISEEVKEEFNEQKSEEIDVSNVNSNIEIEDLQDEDIKINEINSEDTQEEIEDPILNETSVRRLSLFDNISSEVDESIPESQKTEPIISENTSMIEESESNEANSEVEPEFSASNEELHEEFNQETEEELLDIPTFLRRQAN